MKIAIGQINTKVGDIQGNLHKIKYYYKKASNLNADMVIFPEMIITGYPPLDLLENKNFINSNLKALKELSAFVDKTACIIGGVMKNPFVDGKVFLNSIFLIHKHRIIAKRHKSLLPTYDIFDEARYFEPAQSNLPVKFKKFKIGLTICEDIWANTDLLPKRTLYKNNPLKTFLKQKVDFIINISASPYYCGKVTKRLNTLIKVSKNIKKPIVYCNLVGANDELVFDGNSFILNSTGQLIAKAKSFEEDLIIADISNENRVDPIFKNRIDPIFNEIEELHNALVLGIKDYFSKTGFNKAIIGLSGGIDSAVVLYLATKALGKDNVSAVLMPSKYTSSRSMRDAKKICENLGVRYSVICIDKIYELYLQEIFSNKKTRNIDITMQNIQSRIRGNILMAISNKTGGLVLACGNKSEIAMGYCTLYGDTTGAIAPLSDVLKTTIYKLAKYINRFREIIPSSVLTRPPSAELKVNQKDSDDLPPYEVLDRIIQLYIEENKTLEEIAKTGISKNLVCNIIKKIESNEYKRKQLPMGLKVSEKSFISGRKMPIVKGLEFTS